MTNKIVFLRSNVAARARWNKFGQRNAATDATVVRKSVRPPVQTRNRLVATWRVNPASGRAECCWTFVPGIANDEAEPSRSGASGLLFLRRVVHASFEGTAPLLRSALR